MPINGLMVTFSDDEVAAEVAHEAIRRREGVECGELRGRWLPVVTEAADQRGSRDLHGWLESLPGVDQVGVMLVGFEEP